VTLFRTLLGYAASASGHEEDSITEILAWLLDADERLLRAFLALLPQARLSVPAAAPRVRTQVNGPGGVYDLVLDWAAPRLRVIVEIKVNAELTYGEHEAEDGTRTTADQITRYSNGTKAENTFVVALAVHALNLPPVAAQHPRFLGVLRWQQVHDALVRLLADEPEYIDPEARGLTRQFVALMEARHMAGPKLTFDGMTAAYRFFGFRDAILPILEQARDDVYTSSLVGFLKPNKSGYEDRFERLGFRVWANGSETKGFAFLGLYLGAKPIHEGVPDLYLFLEAPPGSPAHQAVAATATGKIDDLRTVGGATARWQVGEGYQIVSTRRSLAEVMSAEDPAGEVRRYFLEGFGALKVAGIVDALRAGAAK
jgi:hypothetical protein